MIDAEQYQSVGRVSIGAQSKRFRLGKRRRTQLRQAATLAASLTIGLSVWLLASYVIFGPFLIPPPIAVIRAFVPISRSGELPGDIAMSLSRVAVVVTSCGCESEG